jgi:uncharacterized protein (TIGR03437 family)
MRLLLFAALPLMAQSYLLTTLAGGGDEGGNGDGGMATDARLVSPKAMACDPSGNCFIAETNRVRRVGADGRISPFGGTATMPRDIGTDAQGNVYVLETSGAFRIRKFSADGVVRGVIDPEVFIQEIAVAPDGTVFWLTRAGLVRERPDGTRTVVPIVSEFQAQGLAADSAGNAYVYLPSRGELHRIDTAGNDVTQPLRIGDPFQLAVDGAGNLFYTAEDRQSSVRRDPQGRVTSFPATLFFTPNGRGGLYVLAQDAIVNVEASGARTVYAGGGGGDGGPLYNATFSGRDLVSDRAGNLYITDWDLKSVRKISPTGVVSTVARGFASPLGIAMDAAENLYVADTLAHQIKKVSRTGQVTVVAGTGVEGFGGDGGPALQAGLSFPMDVTVDGDGSLYITDSRTRVRRISTDGRIATLVGPDRLTGADSVTVDRQGNLYIADSYGAKILRRTPGGEITTIAEGFEVPTGLTVDSAGTLYFSQAVLYRIWKVAPGGKPVLVAGNGNRDGVGDNGLATQASLLGPYGMTFDPAGNLLFTDHRCCTTTLIRKLEVANLFPRSIVNAATFRYAPIAAGEILTAYWIGVSTDGLKVFFDDVAAPVLYADARQGNVIVPFEVAGREVVTMRAESAAGRTNTVILQARATAPGLFPPIVNARDGQLNSRANPAAAGEYFSLFATGCGQTNPGGKTGGVATNELKRVAQAVTATVGGRVAEVAYAGTAPGLVEGVCQINVRVPLSATVVEVVPVVVTVGGVESAPIPVAIGVPPV